MKKSRYPEKGDVLVFAGKAEAEADSRVGDHFKNFKKGKRYVVSDIIHVGYDMEDSIAYSSMAVIFKDEMFGCHLDSVWDYFVPQEEWRDGILSKIIDFIMK